MLNMPKPIANAIKGVASAPSDEEVKKAQAEMFALMQTMKSADLLEVLRTLRPAITVTQWKKSKDLLIEEIKTALEAEFEKLNAKAEAKAAKAQAKALSRRTIRDAATELLTQVSHFEDKNKKSGPDNVLMVANKNTRSVGFPYAEILAELKKEFPHSNTSTACLRWYVVKMRNNEEGFEGHTLPQRRPRASPTAK